MSVFYFIYLFRRRRRMMMKLLHPATFDLVSRRHTHQHHPKSKQPDRLVPSVWMCLCTIIKRRRRRAKRHKNIRSYLYVFSFFSFYIYIRRREKGTTIGIERDNPWAIGDHWSSRWALRRCCWWWWHQDRAERSISRFYIYRFLFDDKMRPTDLWYINIVKKSLFSVLLLERSGAARACRLFQLDRFHV